jgi:translocator protein
VSAERTREGAVLLGFLLVAVVPSAVGALVSGTGDSPWYEALDKPPFTPPDWVFGPVWSVLYVAMGVAAFLVWRGRGRAAGTTAAFVAFGVQLALNALWTPAFFGAESPALGLLVIVALVFALADTIRRFRHFSRGAALLLVPYLAWVVFATVLNAEILRRN